MKIKFISLHILVLALSTISIAQTKNGGLSVEGFIGYTGNLTTNKYYTKFLDSYVDYNNNNGLTQRGNNQKISHGIEYGGALRLKEFDLELDYFRTKTISTNYYFNTGNYRTFQLANKGIKIVFNVYTQHVGNIDWGYTGSIVVTNQLINTSYFAVQGSSNAGTALNGEYDASCFGLNMGLVFKYKFPSRVKVITKLEYALPLIRMHEFSYSDANGFKQLPMDVKAYYTNGSSNYDGGYAKGSFSGFQVTTGLSIAINK